MKNMKQTTLIFAFILFLSSCSGFPVKPDGEEGSTQTDTQKQTGQQSGQSDGQGQPEEPGSTAQGLDSASGFNGTAINNPNCAPDCVFKKDAIYQTDSPLAVKIIYFDFDKSKIKAEFLPLLEQHATYLTEFPDTKVRLEGHSDERGSREYNIALGERRAKAVKRFLQLKGVAEDQISIVSFGEELPARLGHNEAAWALNRRVEIIYE